MKVPEIASVFGVDFSGAKLAGRNTWVARLEPIHKRRALRLTDLSSLEALCGSGDRDEALAHLVRLIGASDAALWGMDFPFGLPLEILKKNGTWPEQLDLLRRWRGEAYSLGLWCVERSRARHGRMHVRRTTDYEVKTPFDCYHYRIIYQTFHGIRDVLAPLAMMRGTAVLPFQYHRLSTARRVLVESCPSSTLKRLGLPHQNYKQPQGGPLTPRRRRTRARILAAVRRHVAIAPTLVRRIMRNPGGDALDAVIAALGAYQAFISLEHRVIARHPRYRLEGHIYS